ncbi:TATA element modulatory factor 1 TATA binding domain-containing protein [Ditylenchus destructor]|uniref:TATA element modulatory factor 1 TATA binding domain-containing protein n=1 Tax=Ditylenchus destructor TaxID=166010 RepID=A0AAD4N1A6_9BILA|nr:TATA element modulatory factor 1 TATA binding domain-containing protein [Ditylenchus destructor]
MSFSWANKLAKSASLLANTAQRAVDSVLDITEEDEGNETTNEDIAEEEDNVINEDESHNQSEQRQRNISPSQFHNDSDASISQPTNWNIEIEEKDNREVVDAEPNPIRDAHEQSITSIFHYSPSSNSPDEEDIHNTQQPTTSTSLDLSLITLEENESEKTVPLVDSDKTMDRHNNEEVRTVNSTIASSDIEIIRHVDEWSVASSNNHYRSPGTMEEINLNSVMMQVIDQSSQNQQMSHLTDQIAILNAKLRHKEQKIEELCKANEKLNEANSALISKNKQISSRASVETKLQRQLAEKDKELNDLMDEGRRLSEHSGKQSKEIRKLKQQLAQLEIVTAARDSTMEELQSAHLQIQEQNEEISSLKDAIKTSESKLEEVQNEFKLTRASSGIVERHIEDQKAQLESATEEINRLSVELKAALQSKEELSNEIQSLGAKLINRRVQDCLEDEREKGHVEDLTAERARNAALQNQIRDLEQRNEALMASQREIATQITEANSPLLANIQSLEEKISNLEKQNEILANQLRKANDNASAHKRKLEEHSSVLAQRMEEHKRIVMSKDAEFESCCEERNELKRTIENLESNECAKLQTECLSLQQTTSDMSLQLSQLKLSQSTASTPVGSLRETQREELPIPLAKSMSSGIRRQSANDSGIRMDLAGPHMLADLDSQSLDRLRMELEEAHEQLFELHKKFDGLLEMYGGCLETIDELKYDNEDLRTLCKQQALQLIETTNGSQPNIETL